MKTLSIFLPATGLSVKDLADRMRACVEQYLVTAVTSYLTGNSHDWNVVQAYLRQDFLLTT